MRTRVKIKKWRIHHDDGRGRGVSSNGWRTCCQEQSIINVVYMPKFTNVLCPTEASLGLFSDDLRAIKETSLSCFSPIGSTMVTLTSCLLDRFFWPRRHHDAVVYT